MWPTAWCSTGVVTMRWPRARPAQAAPLSARLLASVPPLVNTISRASRADRPREPLVGVVERLAGDAAERVRRRRVAERAAEERQHRLEHLGAQGRRRGVIEVDRHRAAIVDSRPVSPRSRDARVRVPGVACSLTSDTGRRRRRRMPRKLSALASIALVALLMLPAVHVARRARDRHRDDDDPREGHPQPERRRGVLDRRASRRRPNAGGIVGYQRIDNATTPVAVLRALRHDVDQPEAELRDLRLDHRRLDRVPDLRARAGDHGRPDQRGRRSSRPTSRPPTPGAVTGTIVLPAKVSSLSSSAVAVAALVDSTTGTMVARQVIPSPSERRRSRSRSPSTPASSTRPTPTSRRRASSTAASCGPASTACPPSRTASC